MRETRRYILRERAFTQLLSAGGGKFYSLPKKYISPNRGLFNGPATSGQITAIKEEGGKSQYMHHKYNKSGFYLHIFSLNSTERQT